MKHPQHASAFTVASTEIRQFDGLFSLNDLHVASGGNPNHRPGEFLRNAQTKALVEEISNAGIPAFQSRRGTQGGTYACRELVVAYAVWISAEFHLKVIRVFLADSAPAPKTLPSPDREHFRQCLAQAGAMAATITLTAREAYFLYLLLEDVPRRNEEMKKIGRGLEAIGSSFASFFHRANDELAIQCLVLKKLRDRCEPVFRSLNKFF